MVQASNLYERKLQEAAEYLSAGQKKSARLLIRDVLTADENNLAAWELLFRASYTSREQMICLKQILKLQPDHPWARQQMAFINAVSIDGNRSEAPGLTTTYSSVSTTKGNARRKRRQEPMLVWASIMVAFLGVICIATWALAAFRIGILPALSINGTATAFAANQASCQALIEKAMQASGQFCNQIGPNRVCYGNDTVKAALVPNTNQNFSRRGDIVNIVQLKSLSASPLNTQANEWGVAIFQIQADLPRSLPGEMVKMVVFGNTSLKNQSGNLQSFYFSSELGQLMCEKLPYDGLMVTMPDGTGVTFTVNGAEMTLMGNASFKATKNDTMQVSLYSGAGRIKTNGHDRYFGAGQKVLVRLGGPDGIQAIGDPSAPQPLSPAEYSVACALTGSYCSQNEIKTLSFDQVTAQILAALDTTFLYTETPTNVVTPNPSASPIPSVTAIPTWTPSPTITFTPTRTRVMSATPTRTPRPRIVTNTNTAIPPAKSSATSGPTLTLPPATATSTPTIPLAPTLTLTNTLPPPTSTPPTLAVCGDVVPSGLTNAGNELDMTITNNHGNPVSLTDLHIVWVKVSPSQKLAKVLLNGDVSWNTSDPEPPSDIPTESNWKASAILTIPDAAAWSFAAQFQGPLEAGNYSIDIVLDIGCKVQASFSIP